MKKDTWILVANSSVAHIYKIEKKQALTEVAALEHPESRLHNRDLGTDKPGRDFESAGITRHSLQPRHSPKENEFQSFAREIAHHLEQGRNKGEFDKLYIAANPNFLGLLRNELDGPTKKLICGEIDKDLTQTDTDEIVTHFPFLF